ncbi:hypothetical protein [Cellulomonas soli]
MATGGAGRARAASPLQAAANQEAVDRVRQEHRQRQAAGHGHQQRADLGLAGGLGQVVARHHGHPDVRVGRCVDVGLELLEHRGHRREHVVEHGHRAGRVGVGDLDHEHGAAGGGVARHDEVAGPAGRRQLGVRLPVVEGPGQDVGGGLQTVQAQVGVAGVTDDDLRRDQQHRGPRDLLGGHERDDVRGARGGHQDADQHDPPSSPQPREDLGQVHDHLAALARLRPFACRLSCSPSIGWAFRPARGPAG